ncbi:hypothetical protein [Nocardia sp. CC227C]|uniref:hypothetical protein n=1 Tax=Nocardia sp. CC227C TaxID=3044562 RepID=UPI00278BD433|nr:hypothetical protein [Nocardia sp. CC227C]
MVNGSPAMVATVDDQVRGVVVFDMRDGKIAGVHGIAAPERIARLDAQWRQRDHEVPLIEAW